MSNKANQSPCELIIEKYDKIQFFLLGMLAGAAIGVILFIINYILSL